MSTRGYVGRLNEDGSVDAIYNHFDSYFDGVGCDLLKSFNDKEKVDALIKRGPGSYVNDKEGYKDETADHYKTLEDYTKKIDNDIFLEFGYIFMDNEWFGKEHACAKPYYKEDEQENHYWEFTPLKTILEAN